MRALLTTALATLLACRASAPSPSPRAAPLPEAATELGFDTTALAAVRAYLRAEVDSGSFPGAVVAVGRHGRLAFLAAVGHHGTDDPRPVDTATIYDLASLTKVIGLTTAVLLLVDAGTLQLDDLVQRHVPAFRGPGKDSVTIRHLLTHSSGLPPWRPLYTEATTRAAALRLADTTLLVAPPGTTMAYSDLGAIVLTQVVETVAHERLDAYLRARVFGPLGMAHTRFLPPDNWRDRIAPTERSQDGTTIRGTVHDENAWRLGGVSGHAGLFSTAGDLARFASWMLAVRAGQLRDATGVPAPAPALVREFTQRQGIPAGSTRALGWDTPSDSGYSSAGSRLSRQSFGHTGFTGTSIWMDPERDLFVILLTNRVNPTRENTRILGVRPRVADLVAAALVR